MNAMPPMVRHQGAGVPGLHGRSQARADQDADAFDRALSNAGRTGKAADEAEGAGLLEAAPDAQTGRAADRDEAEPAADALGGLLPLLRIVVAEERATAEATTAGDITGPEGSPIAAEAEPEAVDRARSARDKAPASAAAPHPSATRPAIEPPAAEARPAGSAPVVAVDSQQEDRRRVEVTTVPAATQNSGAAAPAASASLSLLARLNLMSQEGRAGGTPSKATPVGTAPEGSAAVDDGAPADASETVAARADRHAAGEELGDGASGRREPTDASGRTAERAGPTAGPSPQPGAQPSAPAQVVQALADSPAVAGAARAVVAAHKDGASAGETIQSLKIQLRPHELGQVTAKLSMVGGELSIEIEVDTIEAHRALSGESDAIIKALRAHGIAVDQVTIQQPPQSNTAGRDSTGGDPSAFAGRDARDSGNSGNSAGQNQTHHSPDRDHGHETRSTAEGIAPGTRSTGDVYI